MAFHHGTETNRTDGGSVPVITADTAICGVVLATTQGDVNLLKRCTSDKDFEKFGHSEHLDILRRYNAGTFYIVNILDKSKHFTQKTQNLTLVNGKADFKVEDFWDLEIKADKNTVPTTDYSFDKNSQTIVFSKNPNGTLSANFKILDKSKIKTTEVLAGIKELQKGFTYFGTDARILIAPDFDKDPAVASALLDMADKLKARCYIDANASSLEEALRARGATGASALNLHLSSERAIYLFPKAQGANGKAESLATHAAGLRMLVDAEKGYWVSASNQNLKGVIGATVALTSRPDDLQSDTNALNAVGISTIFNSFGTGFRLWGNRSSCFPTVTHIKNFEVAMATGDFIDENIRRVELQYIDRPIDDALIDSILETIDTFLRTLPSIVGYSIKLNSVKYDLADAFSKGQIPILYDFTPKLPAERITNESVMTREYLLNLVKKN